MPRRTFHAEGIKIRFIPFHFNIWIKLILSSFICRDLMLFNLTCATIFFMFIRNVLVIALFIWHTIREFRRTWQICPYWQRLQMIHYVRTSPQLPWQCDRWRISAPATAYTGTLWKGQIESIVPMLAGPIQSWKWKSVKNIESVGSQPWPGLSWCPKHDDLCQNGGRYSDIPTVSGVVIIIVVSPQL